MASITPTIQNRIKLLLFLLVLLLSFGSMETYHAFADDSATRIPVTQLTETTNQELDTINTDATENITPTNDISVTGTPTVTEAFTETAAIILTASTELAGTATRPEGNYISDEILVRIRPAQKKAANNCFISNGEAIATSDIDKINVVIFKVSDGNVGQALAQVRQCAGVLYAEPNYLAHIADIITNDPGLVNQYGLNAIHAPQGWELSTGNANVTIAIIDTGVDLSHPDLAAKIIQGYDFVENDAIPQDDNGHGTHVAGIAAASGNNGIGISGVSWGARILPVRVLNSSGSGSYANVAAGIIWATDHGAQVINLSLGGDKPSPVLADAVNYAYSRGVVLVAAAGNSGSANILYPARYPQVIAVGAVDNANNRAGISNYGPELDLVAPGVSIYSTLPGGYGTKSGTSMAAPYVSGLAAILCGFPSGGSPDTIAWEMESTALDLGAAGWDDFYGAGLIQMDRAIALVLPPTATPAPTGTATIVPPEIQGSNVVKISPILPAYSPALIGTLTPTSIITPTTSSTTYIPQALVESASIASPTPTNAGKQDDVNTQEKAKTKPSYLLPVLGISLILAGLILAWATIHWQRGWQFLDH